MGYAIQDAEVKKSFALPNGAATTYSTTGIDLEVVSSSGRHLADCDFQISAPALNTTQLPDGKTMKYSVMIDDVNPIDASSTLHIVDLITQTGAASAGAAAAVKKFRLPSDLANIRTGARIVGVRAVGSASGDASGASATIEILF